MKEGCAGDLNWNSFQPDPPPFEWSVLKEAYVARVVPFLTAVMKKSNLESDS
jgi:hypothetical protein